MLSTAFGLYILTLIPTLNSLANIAAGLSGIWFILMHTPYLPIYGEGQQDDPDAKRVLDAIRGARGTVFKIFVAAVIVTVLAPSRSDLMFIVGGSAVVEAASSDRAKGIADQSLKAVEKWLTEQTKEEKAN